MKRFLLGSLVIAALASVGSAVVCGGSFGSSSTPPVGKEVMFRVAGETFPTVWTVKDVIHGPYGDYVVITNEHGDEFQVDAPDVWWLR